MDVDELKSRLYSVRERIARASAAVGREVTLVAATKTVPAEMIDAAIKLGVTIVGENRAQEFVAKYPKVTERVEWHFIGTLQRNKVKYVVGKTSLIHSVSSIDLARDIDKHAAKLGIVQDILVEVNIGGETAKTGASTATAEGIIAAASALKNIRLRGLMAVPPRDADDSVYSALYKLYSRYANGTFDTLSVGMSGDFERAIAFGSNTVRIGTAIFGARA